METHARTHRLLTTVDEATLHYCAFCLFTAEDTEHQTRFFVTNWEEDEMKLLWPILRYFIPEFTVKYW